MRLLCLLILVAIVGAAVVFALDNRQEVTVSFLEWSTTTTVAVVAGAAYVLGMLTGWTIVGLLRRSFNRVTEFPPERRAHASS